MSHVQVVDSIATSKTSSMGFPLNAIPAEISGHLRQRLGLWPPSRLLEAIVWPGQDRPEWDGGHWPLLGLVTPAGTVLSMSPEHGVQPDRSDDARLATALQSPDPAALGTVLGAPRMTMGSAIFRWTTAPTPGPDQGSWLGANDRRLPAWLRPYGGESLVVWGERDEVAGAVALKRHERFGWELSVAVEPLYRGRGLARSLVAQASRRVLRQGGIPIYLHEASNVASARVADASGFPDCGWRLIWLNAEPSAVTFGQAIDPVRHDLGETEESTR